MSSNLNIFAQEERVSSSPPLLSPAYLDAVNSARFVKGFGITALVYSLLLFTGINLLGAGIGIGTGLFIMKYDSQPYYRFLGIAVIVIAVLLPITFISPLILSCAVLWKGRQTLNTLTNEGKEDDDWEASKKRALIGTVTSGVGLLFSLLYLALVIFAIAARIRS